jgi:hypothetical protein
MAEFRLNVPVETREPRVLVEGRFTAGFHRFQLVVFDQDGQPSAPDFAVVQVLPRGPTG